MSELQLARLWSMWRPVGERPWLEQAACKGAPTHIFYPERGDKYGPAKQICAGCPVRVECLEYALTAGEKVGIWGGKSERQRRQIRHDRRMAA